MERLESIILMLLIMGCVSVGAFVFWRYFWFNRNPKRTPPRGENILSPADGKIVYVRRVHSQEPILSTKRNRFILLSDLLREDLEGEKLLIGVFMNPFNVHVNRAPLSGIVEHIKHYQAIHKNHNMGSMHWRTLLGRLPFYENSPHLIANERRVTRIKGLFCGESISCYVNQIAGGSVSGIESFIRPGATLAKGNVFGRIKIGSQVDTIISWKPTMKICVRPGMKVRAGESVFVESLLCHSAIEEEK